MESGAKSIRPHYRLDAWKEAMALVKSELETQILIAKDLGYAGDVGEVMNHAEEVSSLLAGLHKKVIAG